VSGTLYLVATPIGHLADITRRAAETLATVDVVACEDTRTTGQLLAHLGLKKRLVRCDDHTEARAAARICRQLQEGEDAALVSDAGTPNISDPGFRVVRLALEANIPVVPVPGPCSLIAALCVSGLPTHAFRFEGFLPVKKGPRRRRLETLAGDDATQIFFVPPHKLRTWLTDVFEILGDRPACLAREVTKHYEEFVRGPVSLIRQQFETRTPRGEMILMVAGQR
jgi:16S rRNA (cytidine1402-2'-O)-methyltransferase